MAVKRTKIISTPSLDGVTIEEKDDVVQVVDLGIDYEKTSAPLQTLINMGLNLIEVKEPGFYVVDADLNVGFGAENPECFGMGLKNEDV